MQSDEQLIEAWRSGQTEAGEVLFERYYDGVYRFFCNKLGQDIRDLVQQTFVACVEGRDRLREGASFRSYLFAVAHNVLRLHLRARYRPELLDLDTVTAHELAPGPSSILMRSREERLLLHALRSIPLEQQMLLELRYWEQLSSPEIAEVLGVPDNTVRSRLHRAHASLKAAMERLADSPDELASTLDNLDEWARRCRAQLVEQPTDT
ncbi:MAG TPA: sigma-70 family RNA polymerase sigma factor [Haliangium sp.]|nr:sigma-70 family RNA polymerase sigma factor [Haliangium sp.]